MNIGEDLCKDLGIFSVLDLVCRLLGVFPFTACLYQLNIFSFL